MDRHTEGASVSLGLIDDASIMGTILEYGYANPDMQICKSVAYKSVFFLGGL